MIQTGQYRGQGDEIPVMGRKMSDKLRSELDDRNFGGTQGTDFVDLFGKGKNKLLRAQAIFLFVKKNADFSVYQVDELKGTVQMRRKSGFNQKKSVKIVLFHVVASLIKKHDIPPKSQILSIIVQRISCERKESFLN